MELLKRFKRGDIDAFETLFRQFQVEVYGWLVQIVRDPGVAEDLTIETFWRTHKARARFDTELPLPFGAWVRRIARNLAIDHVRSRRREQELSEQPLWVEAPDSALRRETHEMIERAFRQLPPKLQAAAILALVDERLYPEIADLLGAPVGRGRKLLAQTNRIVDAVLGGWTVSGISKYQTGAPSSVNFLVPGGYIGWQGGRADLVAGADIYAGQHDSHDVINGVPWFNIAAFAPPQPWQYGNSERNLLYGPGVWNWDIGVRKFFRITETSQLQFRVDFLNAFNHANLDFGREYQQQGGGSTTVIADTRDGGLPDPRSGKIFSAGTFPGPRVIQLGLKLEF